MGGSESAAKLAVEELNRLSRLHAAGLIGDLDLLRTRAEAEKRRAAADGLRLSVTRQNADENLKHSERAARLDSLQRELAALEGQQRSLVVGIERAGHEIERRRIRATVSGVLTDVSLVKPGAVVADGDRIASLATEGTLRVIASFAPGSVGRLRPGQAAAFGSLPIRGSDTELCP